MSNPSIKYGNASSLVKDFLSAHSFSQTFILVDENTKRDCLTKLSNLSYQLIEIESGERNKTLETCQFIWSELLNKNADRNAIFINLGGGVISDMGGFAASCFKRGIAFLNVPTTLLAMVDATIGGKTGIDFEQQKNMIGLFSQAKGVIIDNSFLETLDSRHIKNGLAEMLKHGLISDENHFNACLDDKQLSLSLIQASVNIKEKIVAIDPYEKGIRKTLNFGHTLGHALESLYLTENKDLFHGEAVAQGMIWATKLSMKFNDLAQEKGEKIIESLEKIYGSISIDESILNKLLIIAKNDKKNEGENILFSLLSDIGTCDYNKVITAAQIKETILV